MTLHVLVEGSSEAAFFVPWLGRLLPGVKVKVHPHQGKGSLPRPGEAPDPRRRGLLCQLPQTLRGLGKGLDPAVDRVLVLVDADADDCRALKGALTDVLATIEPRPVVLFRIAVEELEAFYLGDLAALAHAYPSFDRELARRYPPDDIFGTAEHFGRVVGDGGLNKVAWATEMGRRLTTSAERSRSPSFRALVTGLRRLMTLHPAPQTRPASRVKRHPTRPKERDGRR